MIKQYNYLNHIETQSGMPEDERTTDQEYTELMGIDPSLANTAGLNDAIIDKIYTQNLAADTDANIQEGMDEAKARKMALQSAHNARAQARTMGKKVLKERGY